MTLFICSLAFALPDVAKGREVSVSVDGFFLKGERFLWSGAELLVEGDVTLQHQDLKLQSEKLRLKLSKKKQIESISILGAVRMHHGVWRGGASKVFWSKGTEQLDLKGKAWLANTDMEFKGEKISFVMATEQVECAEDCSLRFKQKP